MEAKHGPDHLLYILHFTPNDALDKWRNGLGTSSYLPVIGVIDSFSFNVIQPLSLTHYKLENATVNSLHCKNHDISIHNYYEMAVCLIPLCLPFYEQSISMQYDHHSCALIGLDTPRIFIRVEITRRHAACGTIHHGKSSYQCLKDESDNTSFPFVKSNIPMESARYGN